MSLEGNISDMPFKDLFEIMTFSPRNCMLEIDRQFYRACLYVQKGEPYAAWISKLNESDVVLWLKGEDALVTLAAWNDGLFCLTEKESASFSRNIFKTKQELLERQILSGGGYNFAVKEQPVNAPDENLEKGKIQALPNFRSKVNDLDLGVHDWAVLIQLDGEMSIEELAQATRLKIDLVKMVVARLIRLELAELVQARQPNLYNLPAQAPAYRNKGVRVAENKPAPVGFNPYMPRPVVELAGYNMAPIPTQAVANNGNKPKRGIFASLMNKIRNL